MFISVSEVMKMKLKGKPCCPHCGRPLTFIYEGSTGFSGEKCERCRKKYLVNTETLEVVEIVDIN